MTTSLPTRFSYRRNADQAAATPVRHPVVVIGAGPVGLTLAIDLATRGVPVVLLDDADRIGEGSRAICFAKRSLEILDRLGVGSAMVEEGVTWKVGRVFRGDTQLYGFDLLPEAGHKMPAFINLQQYAVEARLVARAGECDAVDLRWSNRVVAIEPGEDGVRLTIDTPDGPYRIEADHVVAADGARSPTRAMMGLDFAGRVFEDRFLIADVVMRGDYPTERLFWFDPPFHDGRSALLHRQPHDVWRIDLQLGWQADPEHEKRPEVVRPRIARMLGHDAFELAWVSVYTFQCRRLDRFRHGRVIFAGDSAHQVSPFGARGANSGIQDAENIAWKLAETLAGRAPDRLIDTYDVERSAAADENILNSTRATDFIAPRSAGAQVMRDAVLTLAAHAPFARRMVNSGRLSTPSTYDTPLSTPDVDDFDGSARLGGPLPDAPLSEAGRRERHLLDALGNGFSLITYGPAPEGLPADVAVLDIGGRFHDPTGMFRERYDARAGSAWLVRPDHHLAARWRHADAAAVTRAVARARAA